MKLNIVDKTKGKHHYLINLHNRFFPFPKKLKYNSQFSIMVQLMERT